MIFSKQVVESYKNNMYTRCDDTETVHYFSSVDFVGLNKEEYNFKSSLGHDLKGYIYYYDNYIKDRLIVFDHGFGGGHLAYMKEIEMLCKHGYKVLAYDHTGCMASGGATPNGLAQSLCDLNDCITSIKNNKFLKCLDISVMGHSWGAFSTLNITALHPEISHIVAMCGFVSVNDMINTFFPGLLKGYRKAVMALERESNPVFVNYNAIETLSKSNTKALLIYSSDDHLCKKEHYDMLYSNLKDKENIKFILEENKAHNPNYTVEAVKLLNEFVVARGKLFKNKNLTTEDKAQFKASFDWDKMTYQDEKIWNEIFKHLD